MKICLNCIVKNEAHIIEETLQSVLKYISYWVISDTGSTDNTKEIIVSFFKKHGIPGHLVEHKWKDFGKNRTYALEAAYKYRKNFDYIWVFDADDLVMGDLVFPSASIKPSPDMYSLKYGQGFVYWRHQLFKSSEKWRYVGVLHEYPECLSKKEQLKVNIEGNYYIDSRRLGARSQVSDKYARDAKVLEKGLKDEPNNVRYMFYLGQSYMDCHDYKNAIKWYTKRAEKGGWFEEVFYSLFRVASNMQNDGQPWEKVEAAYMRAWKYCPSRIEPLHEIAKYYRLTKDYAKGYSFAKTASKIPFPKDQVLFLSKNIYDYQALDEMSICSHYMGNYQESFDISNDLLKNRDVPENERSRIEKNRDLNIDHILDSSYPIKKIVDIRKKLSESQMKKLSESQMKKLSESQMKKLSESQGKNKEKGIIFTMTTCKRLDLFTKTINSFISNCEDCLNIDKWLCVDDNSSEEDREKMKKLYPFFEFIMKTPEQKGHVESMNIIYGRILDYEYNVHMEDDFHFFEKRNYLTESIEILKEHKLGQVLFNKNYAERARCRVIAGGIVKYSESNVRYLLHEHYKQGSKEYDEFNRKNNGKPSCMYWPHYSLRPSVLKVSALKEVGDFKNETGHFEMDYANRYSKLGYQSAFLDTISCYHIGKCTWEKGDNSYSLNGVKQFDKFDKLENDNTSKNKLLKEENIDNTWLRVPDMDSYGNDITYLQSNEVEVLKLAALSDPNCIGFNTLGYLKSVIEPSEKWISVSYPNFYMYIHKERYEKSSKN